MFGRREKVYVGKEVMTEIASQPKIQKYADPLRNPTYMDAKDSLTPVYRSGWRWEKERAQRQSRQL